MASTKIADVIVPAVWTPYVINRTTTVSRLWQSGIVGGLDGVNIGGGGTTINMPHWNDLTGNSEVLSDVTPLSVNKITAGQDAAAIHERGKAWGANDLAAQLAGSDPMAAIGDLVGDWWARDMQTTLLSTLTGIFAAASMSGNVLDISAASGEAGTLTGSTGIDAIYKLGDQSGILRAMITHSAVAAALAKLDLIETELPSGATVPLKRFQGKEVIEDDGMPVASGGIYTTYLFGQGAIGYVEGRPETPVETDRDSLQGDDILINRRRFVLHMRGVRWIGTPAGVSPTNVELAVGTNWNRVFANKQLRVVKVIHRLV